MSEYLWNKRLNNLDDMMGCDVFVGEAQIKELVHRAPLYFDLDPKIWSERIEFRNCPRISP